MDTQRHSIKAPKSHGLKLAGIVVMLCGLSLLSLCLGSNPLAPQTVINALLNPSEVNPIIQQIVVDFRLPRILTALLAGAALATAGLLMQTAFRNPLADPFVLGVNSGASLGVAIALLLLAPLGIQINATMGLSGQSLIVFASTCGAALTLFAVLSLFRRVDIMSLLIIGLMISYAISSLVSILMFFSMAEQLQSFLNWSFGDFGNVSWQQMPIFATSILLALITSFVFMKPLDALLLGEEYAASLGTRTQLTLFASLLIASLLAGTTTGFCGPIGFLGIAAPHLARYLFKTNSHRTLIPASLLIGAVFALAADLTSRAPGFNFSLPLNAITALVGAPIIILAILQQKNSKRLF